ncbi:MAG TPA: hypothetical protein VKA10_07935 [Prolixibacteraceae bacterium]|nr:hypothetical protein [Prolixibacteraceae bacterium]
MFNADSVYIYEIPRADSIWIINDETLESMRRNRFPHATGVFTFKKESAIINLLLFFTPQGKKNEEEYLDRLHKKIWYKRVKRFPNR